MRLPACVETRITSPVTSARERMNRVCHRGVFSPAAQDWFEALSAKSVWFTDNNQLNVSRSTWLVTIIIINMLIFYLAWYCTRCSAPRSSAPWSSAPAHCSTSLFLPFAAGCLQRAAADASCTRIPSWPRMVVTTLAPLDVACCRLNCTCNCPTMAFFCWRQTAFNLNKGEREADCVMSDKLLITIDYHVLSLQITQTIGKQGHCVSVSCILGYVVGSLIVLIYFYWLKGVMGISMWYTHLNWT